MAQHSSILCAQGYYGLPYYYEEEDLGEEELQIQDEDLEEEW